MTPHRTRTGFNLSDWALAHRSLVWFLLIVAMIAGALSYSNLGREEDPSFTVKVMVIGASLPGASIEDTLNQVTTRIETKLEELDGLKFTRSVTMPGKAIVYVELEPTVRGRAVRDTWTRVRAMMSDIRPEFPAEFQGFAFNDDFGDVFGNIYAFTADGFSPRELRDRVEVIRNRIASLPDAGKTLLLGEREERIFIELSIARMASLGVNLSQAMASLADQNAITPAGVIETGPERILMRSTGQFSDAAAIAAVNIRVGDRFFNVGDIADVRRGYEDPPESLFRHNGKEALGIQVGMREGGNILEFGRQLDELTTRIAQTLPVGIEMAKVADQPKVVENAIGHFVKALVEAVAIVLAVSFISLGFRAGFVVALSIPLVLAMTFVVMDWWGITLQRISLGALIIALGLLVDDAMIAIETMISRLEIGEPIERAASFAWTSIAFPMLSGTLVTVAGFIPIGLNNSQAGEFTFSLFVVIAVSLLLSWIVAVLFAPLLGVAFLPRNMKRHDPRPGWPRRAFHHMLRLSIRHKWAVLVVTGALFAASLYGLQHVEQQFFPDSDRPELVVDITERQNVSIVKTRADMDRLEAHLAGDDDVLFWTSYVGTGAPRFVLALDVPTAGPHMGQIVIQTRDLEARERVRARLLDWARTEFAGADIYVKNLEVGPPVGKPVQYRVTSPSIELTRDAARNLAALLAEDARLRDISLDWNEPARVARLHIDQDKVRQMGMLESDITQVVATLFSGQPITQLRDDIFLIQVVARGEDEDRASLESLQSIQMSTPDGRPIPLTALVSLSWDTEQPLIVQRDGRPTITVMAGIATGDQPATIVDSLEARVADFVDALPASVRVTVGGTVESSDESQAPIAAVVPMMLLLTALIVMVQMQSFRLSLIVFATAPLGLIGVVATLLTFQVPLGFVAILGVLALVGILIRNAIILVHEIQVQIGQGMAAVEAVFHASDSRARPILLTAAAASLALIPISRQVFWGPMAYAMMGGIIAGTLITLLFVPALYCAVFGLRPEGPEADQAR